MYLNVKEAAEFCRLSPESIERHLRDPNSSFPHAYQPAGHGSRRVLKRDELVAWLESRPAPKPRLWLVDPIARLVLDVPCRIDDMAMLRSILGAQPLEALDMVKVQPVSDLRELVAIGHAAKASDEGVYWVGDAAMRGRAVLAKRLRDAPPLSRGAGDLGLEPVVLDDELVRFDAPPPVVEKPKKA